MGNAQVDRGRLSAEQFLRQWADAWAAQEVDAYLEFYSTEYDPPGEQTLDQWRNERRLRLTRPEFIDVEIDDLQVTGLPDGRMQVRFVQRYRSSGYADRVLKLIDLRPVEDSWRIVRERSLGILP